MSYKTHFDMSSRGRFYLWLFCLLVVCFPNYFTIPDVTPWTPCHTGSIGVDEHIQADQDAPLAGGLQPGAHPCALVLPGQCSVQLHTANATNLRGHRQRQSEALSDEREGFEPSHSSEEGSESVLILEESDVLWSSFFTDVQLGQVSQKVRWNHGAEVMPLFNKRLISDTSLDLYSSRSIPEPPSQLSFFSLLCHTKAELWANTYTWQISILPFAGNTWWSSRSLHVPMVVIVLCYDLGDPNSIPGHGQRFWRAVSSTIL